MSIDADSGNAPGATDFVSGAASSLSSGYSDSTFTFSGAGATLEPGTYWAVINTSVQQAFFWGETAGPLTSSNFATEEPNNEIDGTVSPGGYSMIALYGSSGVPEPSTAAMCGSVAIVVLGGRRRRPVRPSAA